jgi:hypothetical protein
LIVVLDEGADLSFEIASKDEIILSALPMIDTAENPLVVLTSTFHKIFGFFQETWDRAEELGYTRLSWDIFDVTREFDPAIWDDEKLNREIPDLEGLKKRATGRTGDPEGWVPVANIIQAWREKSSIDWFDVEYMGLRPSAEGMVNDPEDVDACVIDSLQASSLAYTPGAETAGGLDWGFQGQTAWDVEMAHKDNVLVQLEMGIYTQVRSGVIIKDIVSDVLSTAYGQSTPTARTRSRTPTCALRSMQHSASSRIKTSSDVCWWRCPLAGLIRSPKMRRTAPKRRSYPRTLVLRRK